MFWLPQYVNRRIIEQKRIWMHIIIFCSSILNKFIHCSGLYQFAPVTCDICLFSFCSILHKKSRIIFQNYKPGYIVLLLKTLLVWFNKCLHQDAGYVHTSLFPSLHPGHLLQVIFRCYNFSNVIGFSDIASAKDALLNSSVFVLIILEYAVSILISAKWCFHDRFLLKKIIKRVGLRWWLTLMIYRDT